MKKYPLLPLYTAIFLSFLGLGMMIPLFTQMMLSHQMPMIPAAMTLTKRLILLGFLLAAYPLGQSTGIGIWGNYSRGASKKNVLLLSTALSLMGYIMIGFSLYAFSLIALFLTLFFTGVAEGNLRLVMHAIADITHNQHRERYFAYSFASMALAFTLGPIIVAIFGPMGYELPFWILSFLLLLLWGALFITPGHNFPEGGHIERHIKSPLPIHRRLFQNCSLCRIYIGNFLLYIALFGFMRAYPIYLTLSYNLSLSELSWLIGYSFLPALLAHLLFLHPRLRLYKLRYFLLGSILSFALLITLASFTNWLFLFWIFIFLGNFSLGLCLTLSLVHLCRCALERPLQCEALAHNHALYLEAETLAPMLIALLAAIALPLSLWVSAAIALASMLLLAKR